MSHGGHAGSPGAGTPAAPDDAVLMVNVGSPDAPTVPAVRRYLREFLSDGRVLDVAPWRRFLLVNFVILPARTRKSAEAYAAVWRPDGAPLLHHSERQREALEARLGCPVVLAMGYGSPSLSSALERVGPARRITVLPMFPHYASATVGSVLHAVYTRLGARAYVPAVRVVPPFFSAAGFLDAQADRIRSSIGDAQHVVLSYHGLPRRQVIAIDRGCLRDENCCLRAPPGCYRAQCTATSRELGARLPGIALSTAFQSRLGNDEWLLPATDAHVVALARQGVSRLAVACPSFVADCLETLEEVGVRLRATFLAAGGRSFTLVPCLNDSPKFIEALARCVETA